MAPVKQESSCSTPEVICLGLNRTGNTTLHAMLESDVLNYRPTLHEMRQGDRPKKYKAVLLASNDDPKTLARRRTILADIVDGFPGVVCDLWGNCYFEDLLDMFPDAKFVLNVRAPPSPGNTKTAAEAWAESNLNTIAIGFSWRTVLTTWIFFRTKFFWRRHRLTTGIFVKHGLLPPETANKLWYNCREWMTPEFYARYNTQVKKSAKQKGRQLLVWHAKQGWEPLCEFLGKPLPSQDTPVPHLNDGEFVRTYLRNWSYTGLKYWAVFFAIFAVIIGLVIAADSAFGARLWKPEAPGKLLGSS